MIAGRPGRCLPVWLQEVKRDGLSDRPGGKMPPLSIAPDTAGADRRACSGAALLVITAWPVLSSLLHPGDYTATVALNWGLSLPSGSQCVYEADSGSSFHGDGTRYHVLDYPENSTVNTALSWQGAPSEAHAEAMTQLLDGLSVPEEERPDIARCRWYSATDLDDPRNRLDLLLSPSGTRLYILESFF